MRAPPRKNRLGHYFLHTQAGLMEVGLLNGIARVGYEMLRLSTAQNDTLFCLY